MPTSIITPTAWLKFTTMSTPSRTNAAMHNVNLSTYNFEITELNSDDWPYYISTLCNNVLHSKVDYLTGESWPACVQSNGTRQWCKNGRIHRDNDKPAWVWQNGDQEWYVNGEPHRDPVEGIDKPAVVWTNGSQYWCVNGQRQRNSIDGVEQPAYVGANGSQAWWVNGEQVTVRRL